MNNVITLMTAISEESADADLLEEGMLREFKEIREGTEAGSALDEESEVEEVAEGTKDEVVKQEVEEEEIFAKEVFAPQIIKEASIVSTSVIEKKEAEARRLEVGVLIYAPVMEITAAEVGQVEGHKPSSIFEHSPTMVCCLSLKTWAEWLLEISNDGCYWIRWVHEIIQGSRRCVATIKGDVVGADGKKKVLCKQEWLVFADEVDKMNMAWRKFSAHVSELSTTVVENFHGKEIKCCPKCLQDNLIKNVVTAHETLQALTEGMKSAGYWRRYLDEIAERTSVLAGKDEDELESSEDSGDEYLDEVPLDEDNNDDDHYEIEEVAVWFPEKPTVDDADEKKVVESKSKITTEKKENQKEQEGEKK